MEEEVDLGVTTSVVAGEAEDVKSDFLIKEGFDLDMTAEEPKGNGEMESKCDLVGECNKKIEIGRSLLNTIKTLNHNEIEGLDKLTVNINKDINFLTKTLKDGLLKKDHVAGSIINQYVHLLSYLLNSNNCTAVLKAFRFKSENFGEQEKKIYVDVVSEGKKKWTKIIRKNPKALSIISSGEGDFGRKSIIDQANEYMECAKHNLHFFKSPLVEFHFACGIQNCLAKILTDMGILVTGKILSDDWENEETDKTDVTRPNQPFQSREFTTVSDGGVTKLNLDVNTMISYISGLTNGETDMDLVGKIMMEQAREERDCPLKPTLDSIFQGKSLYVCESALRAFKVILEAQGGPREKERGEDLLRRVQLVEDEEPNPALLRQPGVKRRTAAVFATGHKLGAVTVTASMGFLKMAKAQGFNFDTIIHEPRSLSEIKAQRKLEPQDHSSTPY